MKIFVGRAEPDRVRRGGFWAVVFSVGLVFCLQACAPKPLYHWGGYDQGIYAYAYKNDPEKAYAILSQAVAEAEANNLRLAPGIYADYGYLLYQRGDLAAAVQCFEKEAAAFPESNVLMKKLIARVKQREATEPAGQAAPQTAPEQPSKPSGGAE